MSARIAVAVALALAAQPVFADSARRRDGGGSSSSSTGARHHSPRTDSASSRSSGGSRSDSPPLTDAQRRHPRAGTGRGSRYHRTYDRGYYGGYPYYRSYYHGYSPYWGYGYWGWGFYDPYPFYYGARYRHDYRDTASIRVLVDPEKTRVYVDGYYAGVADDFDGIFQRLNVSPGRHEIMLKLEGHRTHRFKVYASYSRTLKLHHDMIKGDGEDAVEDLTSPADREEERWTERERDDDADRWADARRDRYGRDRGEPAERGELKLSVRPDDASVYVDGQFKGSARQLRSLELPAGAHRIEVVRPGFQTFERDVQVASGEPTELEVELVR